MLHPQSTIRCENGESDLFKTDVCASQWYGLSANEVTLDLLCYHLTNKIMIEIMKETLIVNTCERLSMLKQDSRNNADEHSQIYQEYVNDELAFPSDKNITDHIIKTVRLKSETRNLYMNETNMKSKKQPRIV